MSAHDTGLAPMYFFSQATPTSAWKCHPTTERDRVLREEDPAFVTVLDVGNSFDRDMTPDEHRAVKYFGPWYADFDGDIEAAIGAFRGLLGKLRGLGLDLDQIRLYATGGRGFHVEVPPECFVPGGLPSGGVAGLPHIYREMAHELFVDLMDMRVYSTKRGRMWRCANHRRDNNKYKVAITAGEALSLAPEEYGELCAAPRDVPTMAAPKFCANLGLLYSRAKDKVSKAKPRKSSGSALRQRFGASLPPTIEAFCAGHIPIREGTGWNKVAMQLAILADELGLDHDKVVKACQGLIQSHESDGRYNTPRRREDHLIEMLNYMQGNVCYSAEVGGLRSILPAGMRVNDFRGLV